MVFLNMYHEVVAGCSLMWTISDHVSEVGEFRVVAGICGIV